MGPEDGDGEADCEGLIRPMAKTVKPRILLLTTGLEGVKISRKFIVVAFILGFIGNNMYPTPFPT